MRRCHSCCGALNTICLIHVSASFWGELTCGSLRSCRSNIVDATKRCTSSSGALVRYGNMFYRAYQCCEIDVDEAARIRQGEDDLDDETKRIMDAIDEDLGYSIEAYYQASLYIPPNQIPPTWLPNVGYQPSRHHDELYSWAPPKELDIEELLGAHQLSIEELITFVPLHSRWAAFWQRCAKGGWGQFDVAKLMAASRRPPGEDKASLSKRVTSLTNRCYQSKKVAMGHAAVPTRDGKPARDAVPPREYLIDSSVNHGEIDFTAYNWLYYGKDSDLVEDCPLLRLAHKVTRMPQGNGKGMLTIAVENAQAKNHWSVMLSELALYVAQEGLDVPEFRFPTSSGALSDLATTDQAARDAFRITYHSLT
ncbi:hypothetical protein HBI75_224310 [Parastagonospora nodorum]|nr:hypothetical protein HBH48_072400 [Parastagonospora nodorum]KAH4879400.1 hypothetical protein HBH58_083880 [Parastagonospora nodorum]KAH5006155.1 hypothetical protein HBI75_224310 [Parastagonospora nodorum]